MNTAYLTDQEITARLRELLEGRNQSEVAREARIEETALSKVLNGHRKLGLGELARLAAVIDIDPGSLLVRDVDPAPLFRANANPEAIGEATDNFMFLMDSYLLFEALAP